MSTKIKPCVWVVEYKAIDDWRPFDDSRRSKQSAERLLSESKIGWPEFKFRIRKYVPAK